MGFFSSKRTTYEVGDVVDALQSGSKQEAQKMLKAIKEGQVPSVSAKEIKKMEKIFKRASEGERGLGAALTSLKDVSSESGKKNFKNIPVSQRVHPSRLRDLHKSGRLGTPGVSTADALKLKQSNPSEYQKILEREARRQGLI